MPRPGSGVIGIFLRVLTAPAMAILLVSCSSSSAPPGANPPTSPPTSGPTTTTTGLAAAPCGVVASPEAVITDGREPCNVSTHTGATVHIVLDPGFTWSTPTSDSIAVEIVNAVRQSSGRLDADLRAVSVGRATVSAAGSVLCPPGQPCPALARIWAVHVTAAAGT
jgi:hypothetical protein